MEAIIGEKVKELNEQFDKLTQQKDLLESQLKMTVENLLQVRGAIMVSNDYLESLNPTPEEDENDS